MIVRRPPTARIVLSRKALSTAARADKLSRHLDRVDSGSESAAEPAPHKVGYKSPPLDTRFKPGQSGNPRGRPKAAKGLKTIVRETMTKKVAVRTGDGATKMSRMEAVFHKAVELAMKGNARALGEVLKLYSAAVPDAPANDAAPPVDDLSATDLAMLEALRKGMLGQGDTQ